MNETTRYSPEVRERAVRVMFGHEGQHDHREKQEDEPVCKADECSVPTALPA